jgi:response regulator RpfG family c-di-GMP phosphodiesterase
MKPNLPNVLVVDDEKNILDSVNRNLNGGFNIFTVSSGQEAIECLFGHQRPRNFFSVIISDYRMPGMNGIELLSRIKKACPELVRIMITGVNDLNALKEAVNLGEVFRLLLKPFSKGELIKAVNEGIIENNRLKQHDVIYGSIDSSIGALVTALETRDYIACGHAERMAELAYVLGFKMGLSEEQLQSLEHLALLHDVGKIGIPDEILFKEGSLTEAQWEIIKTHSAKGFKIAQSSPELASIAKLILTHHEKWDGSGYPLGLSGEEIPLESRILAVVDAYDVITNERPYQKARTHKEALLEIRNCAGSHFDPQVVREFLEIF